MGDNTNMDNHYEVSCVGLINELPFVETYQFKLLPYDIMVFINERKDLFSRIKRYVLGPYEHVAIYLGNVEFDGLYDQFIYESEKRGVILRSQETRSGQLITVMRTILTDDEKPSIMASCIDIASSLDSAYDYPVIILNCIPRLINKLLHLHIPLRYLSDKMYICSEAVKKPFDIAEVYPISNLPTDDCPLPGDFVTSPSPRFHIIGTGYIITKDGK